MRWPVFPGNTAIAQIGTPQQVYEEPADAYVADFLGAANLIDIEVSERVPGGTSALKLGDLTLTTSTEVPAAPGARPRR